MLLFGLKPDDIARPDFFDGAAPSLYPAEPWSPGRFAEGSDPARLIFMFMLLLLWCVFLPYGRRPRSLRSGIDAGELSVQKVIRHEHNATLK